MEHARTIYLDLGFDEALSRVKAAFEAEGFDMLTEIDVQATLADKLGVQVHRDVILETRNPGLAHLSCNVAVREQGDGVVVGALAPVDHESEERIHAALETLRGED